MGTETKPQKKESSPPKDVQIQTEPLAELECTQCHCGIDVSEVPSFSTILCPECGGELTVPARFGNFLLLDLLGTGGMGGVFLAEDVILGRKVAIKVMLKSLGDDEEFVKTFQREAQAAARLNHPNIAQIYSFGQEKGQPYIAMELVSGRNFDDMVDESEGRGLDPALVMRVGSQIADGLALAAEANLIHGDIKPENILLDEREHAKLVDFGIAGLSGQQDTEIWGTPYYIAPEKVKRRKSDERSDIYSLGATLHHAISGHPPFEGATAIDVIKARFRAPAPALRELRPDVPEEVSRIVARMLEQDPAMRYPTYKSLIGDFQRFLRTVDAAPVSGRSVKRVMIKKKGSTGPNGTASRGPASGNRQKKGLVVQRGGVSAPTASITSSGTGMVPRVDTGAAVAGAAVGRPAKKGGKGCLIAFLVVAGLGLLLTIAGIGVGWHVVNKIKRWAEEQVLALDSENLRIEQLKSEAQLQVATLEQLAQEGLTLAYTATGLVFAATGKQIPMDIRSLEEGREGVDTNQVANAGGATPLAPDALLAPDHPMATKTGELLGYVRSLREAALDASALVDEIVAAPIKLPDPAAADNHESAMDLLCVPGDDLQSRLEPVGLAMEQAEADLKSAQDALAALEKQVGTLEELREAAEAKRLEEERKAGEAAEAARREAARLAAVEAEVQMVRDAGVVRIDDLRKHAYERAERNLKLVELKLESDEGRAALALELDRVTRLKALKESLVKYLTQTGGLRRGWIENGQQVDIDSADAKAVTVRGTRRPWADVGTVQMVKLIRHYTNTNLREPRIGTNERADLALNGATYVYLMGQGNERAMELARGLALQAAGLRPSFQAKAKRLMPDLMLDE